jgi:predicted Holliday junction resolvase-like endonuclease
LIAGRVTLLAVDTGVVVIVVAVAVVLVVLIVALSLRGRQVRVASRRRDLDEAHERAGRAERDREIAEGRPGDATDERS